MTLWTVYLRELSRCLQVLEGCSNPAHDYSICAIFKSLTVSIIKALKYLKFANKMEVILKYIDHKFYI